MFVDLSRTTQSSVRADVAIVGTGPCGLVMAKRLLARGATVAMFETGGFERSPEAQELNDAFVSGSLPVWIGSRSRFLGGSSNCWAGNNSPLDPIDFERDWIPSGAWPIRLSQLDPYVDEIHELLHLGPTDFSVEYWRRRLDRVESGLLCESSPNVVTKLIQKTEVGHAGQLLERHLDRSSDVTVYLNAHVTGLLANAAGDKLEHLEVVSTDRTRSLRVEATHVVLAAGPENTRLLLVGDGGRRPGIGNEHGQLGAYWLAHHSSLRGWIEPVADLDWRLYDLTIRPIGECRVFGSLQVSPDVQRREKLLNAAAILEPYRPLGGFNHRARAIATGRRLFGLRTEFLEAERLTGRLAATVAADVVRAGSRFASEQAQSRLGRPRRISVRNWCEQFPHPDNRVELAGECDRFGIPKMRIVSNLQPEDRRTLLRAFEIIGDAFESSGHGRWVDDFPAGDDWPPGAVNTAHFLGGTRMSARPDQGVVDERCRVHGVENLWIAGGSVFPTAGVSMMTYTALLLAARTADHIETGNDLHVMHLHKGRGLSTPPSSAAAS